MLGKEKLFCEITEEFAVLAEVSFLVFIVLWTLEWWQILGTQFSSSVLSILLHSGTSSSSYCFWQGFFHGPLFACFSLFSYSQHILRSDTILRQHGYAQSFPISISFQTFQSAKVNTKCCQSLDNFFH